MRPPARTTSLSIAPLPTRGVRRARPIIAVVAMLSLVAAACSTSSSTGQLLSGQGPRASPQREFLNGAVAATNAFGADLYRALSADPGNFVVSPASVMDALAMARAGSAGTTRQEFDVVLHAGLTPNLDGGINTLSLDLADRTGDKRSDTRRGRVELKLPAALWGQKGTHVKEDLLDLLAADYGTGFRVTDFHADAEGSRTAINNWADDGTDGLLKELVPRGTITQYTRFVATPASTLRAPWQAVFDVARTRPGSFTRVDGQTSEVPMMETATTVFRFAEGPGWDAIELPYLGDELALDVIVPDVGTFSAFEQSFDGDRLEAITTALDDAPTDPLAVTLPTFAFTTSRELQDPLRRLGLDTAFSRDADFSGVTSDEVLSLSDVLYQGFFKIDEEGSDPSPDTATAQPTNDPPVAGTARVLVDRPFLFVVRDRVTGAALLVGRFVNPG